MEIREPVDIKKKLNIIAIADDTEYGQCAVRYGEKLAQVFDATLTVVVHFGFSLEPHTTTKSSIAPDVNGRVLEEYLFPESLYRLAERENTILFVIGIDTQNKGGLFNKRRAMRFIKGSRLPVMTVGNKPPEENAFQRVVLPIDIERQSKEKALWAGYFSRFYNATILILHPKYKDAGLAKQVSDNITFVQKLYTNLEVRYEMEAVEPVSHLDRFSIPYAIAHDATLTVITMTKYHTVADWLTGPREKQVLGNPESFPVLCINQRDDLYVLCT